MVNRDVASMLSSIGPFPAMQIVPSVEAHELLTQKVKLTGTPEGLTNHGGRTISSPKSINVYLDTFPDNIAQFDAFSKDVIEGGFLSVTVPLGGGLGKFIGSYHLQSGLSSGTLLDSQIQSLLHNAVSAKQLPTPDANTCFFFIIPDTLEIGWDNSTDKSCSAFCGYHTKSSQGIYYAVQCEPSCLNCHGDFTPQDARTMVYAHELGEWVTDPDGNAWYGPDGNENGDVCAWNLVRYGPINTATKQPTWAVQPLDTVNPASKVWSCGVGSFQAPVPVTNHAKLQPPMANVWAYLIANPSVVAQLGLIGLDADAYTFWNWATQNPTKLQLIVDSWAAWLRTQPAL